jgi:putative transposase
VVFRLIAFYRRKRCTSVLVAEPRGRKCGSRVLDPNLEKIIETAIKDFYLRREKPSLASLHREVQQACHKAGATPPSYKAIQSRVRDFDAREVITRRMGPKQAAQRLSPVKAGLQVKEPLELLQMDHTLSEGCGHRPRKLDVSGRRSRHESQFARPAHENLVAFAG